MADLDFGLRGRRTSSLWCLDWALGPSAFVQGVTLLGLPPPCDLQHEKNAHGE